MGRGGGLTESFFELLDISSLKCWFPPRLGVHTFTVDLRAASADGLVSVAYVWQVSR